MPQDFLIMKLELLRLMSKLREVPLVRLERELGLGGDSLSEIISQLKQNYLMKVSEGRLVWSDGDNPSTLSPWGWNYEYKVVVGSTMNIVKHMPPWSVVLTEYQVMGRGRKDKEWISNLGGIWLSFKIPVSQKAGELLPLIVPIILVRTIRDRLEKEVFIKWPNDIVVGDKKIAGILISGEAIGNTLTALIGIGINVNNEPPLPEALSLSSLVGKLIPRNRLLSHIIGLIGRIEKFVEKPEYLRLEYLDHLFTLGKKIEAQTPRGIIRGVAKNVTETGELVVETDSGSVNLSWTEVNYLRHRE